MEVTEKIKEQEKKPKIAKIDMKELFRKFFSHNPHRDWAILLILFAILVVGIIVWQFQLFAQIQRGEAFTLGQKPVVQVGGINRQDLMKTVGQLNEKKQLFEFLKKTLPAAIDPSI